MKIHPAGTDTAAGSDTGNLADFKPLVGALRSGTSEAN